ncbi:MAG: hypothetical protein KatS3mg111_3096 [Pirellulaceae bacterium]|nr:MAG: hypothetical protein KatS3mg111_3096 [Pirellulaceae bacterium]
MVLEGEGTWCGGTGVGSDGHDRFTARRRTDGTIGGDGRIPPFIGSTAAGIPAEGPGVLVLLATSPTPESEGEPVHRGPE